MPTMLITSALQRENSTLTNEIMPPLGSIIRPLLLSSSSYIVGLYGNSNLAKSYYLIKIESRKGRKKEGAAVNYGLSSYHIDYTLRILRRSGCVISAYLEMLFELYRWPVHLGLHFTLRAFSRRFYPKPMTPLHAHIHTPTARWSMRGDSQLVRSGPG